MQLDTLTTSWPPPSTTIELADFQNLLDAHPALPSRSGSITWHVNGERILVFGWGRAILMQIAHPLVAEGVAHHSVFSHSLQAKIQRFYRTLEGMLRLTFGTPEEVWRAAQHIDQIHARVNGVREPTQTVYSARDIELLKWVHATFVDSILKTYSLFVRPLSGAEMDDYVYKASIVGPLLGAPRGYFPESMSELTTYIGEILNGRVLKVDAQTQQLARYVLDGVPIPILQHGLAWYLRLSTALLLPFQLREAYGLRASRAEYTFFQLTASVSRFIHRLLPACLRRWQMALKAEVK